MVPTRYLNLSWKEEFANKYVLEVYLLNILKNSRFLYVHLSANMHKFYFWHICIITVVMIANIVVPLVFYEVLEYLEV